MLFVKTFKGYEDKVDALDKDVNGWVANHKVDVVAVETTLSHEPESRARSGDLVYTVVYRAEEPVG
jgi:hypothetical protein